ncbi:DUF3631 domain-containing protein [Kutzneria kofuensis]|uniref:NAD dependent epimerase/dehydratase family enzyme n=1 Tax=Kutzneria kofuensis TaxID=103725 RepID=A0A7W9KSQ2_9PSEU|nr:DUF3631 domain-containing protein [Kutzneria kofuensis]MBB5898035.1 NAD dependent epimerase/dehydratase family enzyme [Kutzneria kofuensis]
MKRSPRCTDRLATKDLLAELWEVDDRPWIDLAGKALTDRRMSKELRKYLVAPNALTTAQVVLTDAWSLYLPL